MMDDGILVGVITGAHGLKGEVRAKAFTETAEALASYGNLYLESGNPIRVLSFRGVVGDTLLLLLEGISDRNAAELLRGSRLFIRREQLPPLEEGFFYQNDLVSMHVNTIEGQEVGTVVAIHNYGASDILEIKTLEGGSIMAPFIEDAVESVDLEQGIITVHREYII